jgi:hypothetical protein
LSSAAGRVLQTDLSFAKILNSPITITFNKHKSALQMPTSPILWDWLLTLVVFKKL